MAAVTPPNRSPWRLSNRSPRTIFGRLSKPSRMCAINTGDLPSLDNDTLHGMPKIPCHMAQGYGGAHLALLFDVGPLYGGADQVQRLFCFTPALHFDPLIRLQVLIVLKEVGYLLQQHGPEITV